MKQMGFHIDMTTCIGCKTCHVACKDKNDLKTGANLRQVRCFEGGKYPNPWMFNLSMSCNHCAEPKCMSNCPTGAIYKREDGIVAHNLEKCIGCKYCTWSCPYGAPQYDEEKGKARKCDMCADLIDKGLNPVCVNSCVMRALKVGEFYELKAEHKGTQDLVVLPKSNITKPSVVITPKPMALKGV